MNPLREFIKPSGPVEIVMDKDTRLYVLHTIIGNELVVKKIGNFVYVLGIISDKKSPEKYDNVLPLDKNVILKYERYFWYYNFRVLKKTIDKRLFHLIQKECGAQS